jgi:ABC-type microcin C transport system permease subunit YejB
LKRKKEKKENERKMSRSYDTMTIKAICKYYGYDKENFKPDDNFIVHLKKYMAELGGCGSVYYANIAIWANMQETYVDNMFEDDVFDELPEFNPDWESVTKSEHAE